MKVMKIGKRIVIGVALVATGFFIAYRIGTYNDDTILYNGILVQEVVFEDLEEALNEDDVDVGFDLITNSNDEQIEEIENTEEAKEASQNAFAIVDNNNSSSKSTSNSTNSDTTNTNSDKNNSNSSSNNSSDKSNNSSNNNNSNSNSSSTPNDSSNNSSKDSSPSDSTTPSVSGTYNTTNATTVQNTINDYRSSLGLSTLTYDTSLANYAKTRAYELSIKFSHTRPDGSYAVSSSGKYKSEIIATGTGSSASRTVSSWKYSTEHNSIMTSTSYTKFGAAEYIDTNGNTYWVVIFG